MSFEMRRRVWLFLATAALVLALIAPRVEAREHVAAPELIAYPRGSILVRTSERRLYFITGQGQAIRYPVGVGKAGQQWTGLKYVEELAVEPHWIAPPGLRRDRSAPEIIPPGPRNPMGARVIGLGPGGDYAIHGTNDPSSIGRFVSFGCIRMFNDDVIDLYGWVRLGPPVVVAGCARLGAAAPNASPECIIAAPETPIAP
ncbi:MAG: L,D-transpeptidase [Beijerinckiaceae bacterium]